MKVVLINTSENKGGAAVACKRLFNNLKQHQVDCKLIVFNKSSMDDDVIKIPHNRFKYKFIKFLFFTELILQKLFKKKHVDFSFSYFGIKLSELKEVQEADIIHLHWIHNSFVQIDDLQTLLNSGKKIVWTLHDMWAFTGGCHYAGDCQLYKNSCHQCPQLKTNSIDIAKRQFIQKKQLELNKIRYITPSKWLKNIGEQSNLLRNATIDAIPNCINTNAFVGIPKSEALKNLGLTIGENQRILLYIAMNAEDPRKGYKELIHSLNYWTDTYKEKINLLIIGRLNELPAVDNSLINIISVGRIFDEKKIISAYSCADAFIMPSQQDNLPNTIMESLSCGTPIVAFTIGGIPEMIKHQETGYLAKAGDCQDFAEGIQWTINNAKLLTPNCRKYAEENFQNNVVYIQHCELYTTL